jgi:hypothetical protein
MKIRSLIGYGCLLKHPLLLGDEEVDWMDFIAEKYELKRPTSDIKKVPDKYKKYWKKRDALIKELGVRIEPYGSFKTYNCFLVVSDSLNFSTDDIPTCLYPGDLDTHVFTKNKWDKQLTTVLNKLEIETDTPFNWYLTAYWEEV